MSRRQKYLNVLSEILPAGLVGVSMVQAGASSSANEHPAPLQPHSPDSVSERLAAIRDAVSTFTGAAGSAANGGAMVAQLVKGTCRDEQFVPQGVDSR
jgi:hypothetical protein